MLDGWRCQAHPLFHVCPWIPSGRRIPQTLLLCREGISGRGSGFESTFCYLKVKSLFACSAPGSGIMQWALLAGDAPWGMYLAELVLRDTFAVEWA